MAHEDESKFKGVKIVDYKGDPNAYTQLEAARCLEPSKERTNKMNDVQGDELEYNIINSAMGFNKHAVSTSSRDLTQHDDIGGVEWMECLQLCTLSHLCAGDPRMNYRQPLDKTYPMGVDAQIHYYIDKANKLLPTFIKALTSTFRDAEISIGPIKLASRCLQKLKEDTANASQIYDYLRASVAYVDVPSLIHYFNIFKLRNDVLRVKSRLAKHTLGNRCILVNFTVGNAACYMITEVQLTTVEIAKLNKIAHESYAGTRATGASGVATPALPAHLQAPPIPGKLFSDAEKAISMVDEREAVLQAAANRMAKEKKADPVKMLAGLKSLIES